MVDIWSQDTFLEELGKHAWKEFSAEHEAEKRAYLDGIAALQHKATLRGDGLAIYVNEDFGSRDLGQWKIATYGSSASLLETRAQANGRFVYAAGGVDLGDNILPRTLPDTKQDINWRYVLKAVVPVQHAPQEPQHLVTVQVLVKGGVRAEVAQQLVLAALNNGAELWHDTAGTTGFAEDDDTGTVAFDLGARLEVFDSSVI